uniref:Uncharacterized protein n=1 Tax=Anguilla anguilla TaxID=7936 RepID=A0A0E9TT56_ANGAN
MVAGTSQIHFFPTYIGLVLFEYISFPQQLWRVLSSWVRLGVGSSF